MNNFEQEKYMVYGKNNILTTYGFRSVKELQNHQIRLFATHSQAKCYMRDNYGFINDYEIKKVKVTFEVIEDDK